jgi:hypothetical protein
MLSRLLSANSDCDEPEHSDAQSHANAIFAIEEDTSTDDGFPLVLNKVFNEQQKELSKH